MQDKWRVRLYGGIAAAGKGTAGPNGGPYARGEGDAAVPKVLSTSSNGPVRGTVALAAAPVPFVDATALSLNGRGPGGRSCDGHSLGERRFGRPGCCVGAPNIRISPTLWRGWSGRIGTEPNWIDTMVSVQV